jgi:F-type H+-transporting ATPase subunit b
MEIDWFTLAAQIVNFAVLVFLLKHFLYGRIVEAMEERQRRISDSLDDARRRKEDAEEEARKLESEREELAAHRERMMRRAEEEASRRREDLYDEARRDVTGQKDQWLDRLRRHKERFHQELKKRAGEEIFTALRESLRDLADQELEERIIDTFLDRLAGMAEEERRHLTDALSHEPDSIRVESGFPLPEKDRARIRKALEEAAGKHLDEGSLEFRHDTPAMYGIELRMNGFRLSWNLERFMEAMKSRLDRFLEKKSARQ